MPRGSGDQGRSGSSSRGGKGSGRLQEMGGDTLQLVVDYVKQETLDPLKGLGRFILFGVAGSVLIAGGFVILMIGLLRLLQTETGSAFTGNLSWVPYVIVTVVTVGVAIVAGAAVQKGQARKRIATDKEKA